MKKRLVLAVMAILVSGAALGFGFMATDHSHGPDSETVNSHSRGTDAYGCHTDHSTGLRHCH